MKMSLMALLTLVMLQCTRVFGQSFPSETFVQEMKRFHQVDSDMGRFPSDATVANARRLTDVIETERKAFPKRSDVLAFYLAKAKAVSAKEGQATADEKNAIVALAGPIAKDLGDCNCADARLMLFRLGRTPMGAEYGLGEKPARIEGSLREVYPVGLEADLAMKLLDRKPIMMGDQLVTIEPAPTIPLKDDKTAILKAAKAYRDMNMIDPALHNYRLALGFVPTRSGLSPECSETYMSIGDCLSLKGQWKQALAYYLKSLGCGQPLTDITRRLRDMDAAINEDRKVPAALPEKPDAVTLVKIAGMLADDDLFDEAIEAAQAAQKADPTAAPGLVKSLHQKKADLLRKAVQVMGEGPIVRGTKATQRAIEQEESLAH